MLQSLGLHLGLVSVNVLHECSVSVIKSIKWLWTIWIPGIFVNTEFWLFVVVFLFHIIVIVTCSLYSTYFYSCSFVEIFCLFVCFLTAALGYHEATLMRMERKRKLWNHCTFKTWQLALINLYIIDEKHFVSFTWLDLYDLTHLWWCSIYFTKREIPLLILMSYPMTLSN